jgi:plastocyanin domain-containing protein
LEDYVTGEIIFPFGNYTKINCDSTSNYFIIDLNTLPINRTYKLKLKIVENGISTIIDDKLIFEIV